MVLVDQLRVRDKNLELFHYDWEQASLEYKTLEDDIQDLEKKLSNIADQAVGLKIAMEHMLEQKTERKFLLTVHMNKLRQAYKGIVR
jgi:predicted  nucleic acid-binding Zn-ribbon protein